MENIKIKDSEKIKELMVDRFMEYVKIDTMSDPNSTTFPSTSKQFVLAEMLVEECVKIGFTRENVNLDKYGYVIAKLPSNLGSEVDRAKEVIGFFAHMDTSPDFSGKDVKPRRFTYTGGDIKLSESVTISPSEFKELDNYKNQELIVADGKTLLGADDKAGIAEIMTAMEYIINNDVKHNDIYICFTPDEEVGQGVDKLDITKVPVDFGYTLDGSEIGEFECENFNASGVTIEIKGKNVHPGTAKNIMINSSMIAGEIISLIPENQVPEKTEGYEGFYHVTDVVSTTEQATIKMILRDFDEIGLENRKNFLYNIEKSINSRYSYNVVCISIKDQYKNMKEQVDTKPEAMKMALDAMEKAGVTPLIRPIRGGTDGARLSAMGLICPNIFTGGHNFHGPYEYVCVESMLKAVNVILNISGR